MAAGAVAVSSSSSAAAAVAAAEERLGGGRDGTVPGDNPPPFYPTARRTARDSVHLLRCRGMSRHRRCAAAGGRQRGPSMHACRNGAGG
eukprot:125605-Chlamydomonas_euryale.AAC.4